MQQPVATTTSPASPSFAGLLAAFAAPAQRPGANGDGSLQAGWKSGPGWSDDGLEDDVATLSYERALRAHARYRNPDPLAQDADPGPNRFDEPLPAAPAIPRAANRSIASPESGTIFDPIANPEAAADRFQSRQFERNLKSASITIRLSKVECAQLHKRAADAGLTVSAYLRSCTFEAESLRAMVKDTLAQLRSAKAEAKPVDPEPVRRSWLGGAAHWLARLLTPWHGRQRIARA